MRLLLFLLLGISSVVAKSAEWNGSWFQLYLKTSVLKNIVVEFSRAYWLYSYDNLWLTFATYAAAAAVAVSPIIHEPADKRWRVLGQTCLLLYRCNEWTIIDISTWRHPARRRAIALSLCLLCMGGPGPPSLAYNGPLRGHCAVSTVWRFIGVHR